MMKRRIFLNNTLKSFALAGLPALLQSCATPMPATVSGAQSAKDDLERIAKIIADKATPVKWLFTGDSITHGAKHTYGRRSYPEIFAERIRTEMGRGRDFIINTAISGHTSKDIRSDFDWRVKQFSPRIISLMIGTNDAATTRSISVAQYEDNMNWLIKNFRSLDAIPIIHTPNTIQYKAPGGDVRLSLPKYIDVIYKTVKSNDVILVDNWKYWKDNNTKAEAEGWFADPLHPSGKGHLELARLLFKTINIFELKSFTCTGNIVC
jgi:acyl-CoA thioesterase-1